MSENTNLQSLFAGANLGNEATQALTFTADNLGHNIMAGLGDVDADAIGDLGASEVLLVKLVMDDSSSILYGDNTQHVIDGHNLMVDALRDSKASGAVLISCQYLNGEVLYPFVTLDKALRMTNDNYQAIGGTPLYDTTAVTLASVVAKAAELEDAGLPVRTATYIVTDGNDEHSRKHRPDTIRPIVEGMLRTESHIIGAMGIDDGRTDFRQVFGGMGFHDRWILTPANTPTEIRAAFGTFSQSAVRASQAVGSFSATAMGGFGN